MRNYSVVLFTLVAACGGSSDSGSAAPGDGAGGGNVSFGGAQDIGSFRAALERGEIPEQGSLDANGFFNEHYNATPPSNCTGDLCLTPGLSITRDWLTGQKQMTLQIAVSTPRDPSEFPRLPMNLAVVVDHSGSMAEDGRLDKVKVGLHTLVDELEPEDRLTIISFDDQVTIDAPFTTELNRATLHAAVDGLRPRGSTNIYAGLEAGFQAIPEERYGHQNRVILLSDGLATAGITDRWSIMEMARDNITGGIGLTTIGVGDSFDVELMRGLAENGAGNYYFLEDATAASEVFTEELDYFLTPIAMNIELTARTRNGWSMNSAAGSRIWSNDQTAGIMAIPAAFIASRRSQEPGELGRRGGGSMIFIGLDAAAGAGAAVADLQLSYTDPATNLVVTQNVSLDYAGNPLETPAEPYLSAAEMGERMIMYNTFLGIRAATNSYDTSCAAAALRATRERALAWNTVSPDPDIAADVELIDMFLANLAETYGELAAVDTATCDYSQNGLGYDDDVQYTGMACSTGGAGGAGGALILVGAALSLRRRRRAH